MTAIPTKPGDVLILHTRKSFKTFIVGRVTFKGQQDFSGLPVVQTFMERQPARLAAHAIRESPDHAIYEVDLDTQSWRCLTEH